MQLRLTHCLAQNMDAAFEAIARRLEAHCGVQVSFDEKQSWQAREHLVAQQKVDLAWICGLLYCFERTRQPDAWQAFAAVSLSAPHYKRQPIYFTEVVCSATSPYKTLIDLRGSRFVYNDIHSLSGYYALWHTLKERGLELSLAEQQASGGHYASTEYLLTHKADFSLIDSSVFESWQQANPTKASKLRSVERLGPYPSPPLLLSTALDPELRKLIRQSILTMSLDRGVRQALKSAGVEGFVPVDATFYDSLEPLTKLGHPQTN